MNPVETIIETTANWVIDLLVDHNWTVVFLPLIGFSLFFSGLMAGRSKS